MSLGGRLFYRSWSILQDCLLPAPRGAAASCLRFSTVTTPGESTAQGSKRNDSTNQLSPTPSCHGETLRDRRRWLPVPARTSVVPNSRNVRRVVRVAIGRQKFKQDRATANSRLKAAKLRSDDWQTPLRLLQQSIDPVYTHGMDDDQASVRSYWYAPSAKREWAQVRANQIPRPRVWSQEVLAKYVDDLAQSWVSRQVQQRIYKEGESHSKAVTDIIKEIFHDPAVQDHLTPQAFNTAAVVLYKNGMVPTVRSLFTRMERLGWSRHPEIFNTLLRSVAAEKDLHLFTFLLRVMIRRGVKPNAGTWIAFLLAMDSKVIKLHIVKSMAKQGLLSRTSVVKDVVNQLVKGEVVNHLQSGQQIAPYLDIMDQRYGPNWLSVSASNRMVDDLGERGLISDAVQLTDYMASRGSKPNLVTLNTILGHCARQLNVVGAIAVLDLFENKYDVHPAQLAYRVLFVMCWKLRQANLCRVLWSFACAGGLVSHMVEQLVMRSLLGNHGGEHRTMTTVWKATAGMIITGYKTKEHGLLTRTIKDMMGLTGFDFERVRYGIIRDFVITKEVDASSKRDPTCNLAMFLKIALEKDKLWVRDGIWKETSLSWKVKHAVNTITIDSA